MGYKKGFEHFLFLKVLALSIPKGAALICKDTIKRKQWLDKYPHLLTGSMLLTSFAYAEGMLGTKWIQNHGKDFEEELNSLRIIRNAITHNDGYINKNKKAIWLMGLTGAGQLNYVNQFVRDLKSGSYKPLVSWELKKKETYIEFEKAGFVKLGKSSYGRIGAVINNVLKRAGKIEFDDKG